VRWKAAERGRNNDLDDEELYLREDFPEGAETNTIISTI
jgi:hypothetical protein